jgi:hypothetical protein
MQSTARQIDHSPSAKTSAIEIFRERCEARSLLVSNGLMTLHDAVDELQEVAVRQGLVARYGQDEIQWILSEAFGRWRV